MTKRVLIPGIFFIICVNMAVAQKMTVKDSDSYVLMEVNDEGSVGSLVVDSADVRATEIDILTMPSVTAPSPTTYKLYNVGGTLYWNGSELGTASSANGWTDDGEFIRLTNGSDKVGIGITTPAFALDVKDSLGINGFRMLYLPNQFDLSGTMIVGNGGANLKHTNGGNAGKFNTAIGVNALNLITTATENTACGYSALFNNETGNGNTAFGSFALILNSTGSSNTAIGSSALYNNTTGQDNTACGYVALQNNTTGTDNTATGYAALLNNTTGNYNTANGRSALVSNSSGRDNSAFGHYSLVSNTSGDYNTACGSMALYENTNGYRNTALGQQASRWNTTGTDNTVIGYLANCFNGAGSSNTIIGSQAGSGTSSHDKSRNVFIGYMAGYNETENDKLYIENSSSDSPLIWGDFSNDRVVINGNSSHNENDRTFFVNGSAGGTGDWYNDSDGRLKKNIETIPNALEKVQRLRGVNFKWKDADHHEQGVKMGFIAQEAKDIIPEVVSNCNDHYSMQYAPITALLVEAIKEQHKQISLLEQRIQELEKQ